MKRTSLKIYEYCCDHADTVVPLLVLLIGAAIGFMIADWVWRVIDGPYCKHAHVTGKISVYGLIMYIILYPFFAVAQKLKNQLTKTVNN